MNEFCSYLPELFELFGPVSVRKMFGGYGVFRDGLMFALVVDDSLYLKADAENTGCFQRLNLGRFEYIRSGKIARLSYYQAPPEIMEDRELAAVWARRSYDAALRAQRKKPKSKTVTKKNDFDPS